MRAGKRGRRDAAQEGGRSRAAPTPANRALDCSAGSASRRLTGRDRTDAEGLRFNIPRPAYRREDRSGLRCDPILRHPANNTDELIPLAQAQDYRDLLAGIPIPNVIREVHNMGRRWGSRACHGLPVQRIP